MKTKTLKFRSLFSLVVFSMLFTSINPLWATTYYVSTSGNDNLTGTSPGIAWRHIAYGTQRIQAGDTLIIKSGNYGNEYAKVHNSGTAEAPIVIQADVPGEVILTGNGTGTGIYVENKNHISIEGIKFVNYSTGVSIKYSSTYITVRKCIFLGNNNFGIFLYGTKANPSLSHHHLFTENEFYDYTDDKQDYGIILYFSSFVKANNNYFFGWHHQALSFKKSMFNSIASENIFEGFRYSALYLGQNLDMDSEGGLRCHNLIAEKNTFKPATGFRAKTSIWIANVERAIVRNNFIEGRDDVDGAYGQGFAIGDSAYNDDTYTANPAHVAIYNNVIRTVGGTTTNPGIRVMHDCDDIKFFNNTFVGCAYGLGLEIYETLDFKNNIFSGNQRGMIRKGDAADAQNCTFEYNNFYPNWTGKTATDISFDPLLTGSFTNLLLTGKNPKFTPDFSRSKGCKLQSSSPCIDAGTFLTKTRGSGNGTIIAVVDAGYFTDGFGITTGDLIQLESEDATIRITNIDYVNNIITVDSTVVWETGQGIGLPYSGSAPNMGAFEYN